METEKILPMNYPPLTSYPTHANIMACISQYPNSMLWFYDNYIQLFAAENYANACYIDFYSPLPWKTCPWVDSQKINRALVDKQWGGIAEFLKDAIDSGFYTFLFLDCFYVPAHPSYQKHHFTHESFVFGYNMQEKTFNIADFYNDQRYGYSTICFANLEAAYRNANLTEVVDIFEGIILVKPVNYEGYVFDKNKVINLFTEYLTSTTTKGYAEGYRKDVGEHRAWWLLGMDVYQILQTHMEYIFKNPEQTGDIRGLHNLVDHKALMVERIYYYKENNIIKYGSLIHNNYKEIHQHQITLRNMVIKAKLTGNGNKIDKALDLLTTTIELEKYTIEILLNSFL